MNYNNPNYNGSNQNNSHSNIDPVKLRIIDEIRAKSQGKSLEEMLPQIMKINNEMKRRNISFTKEETTLLINEIEQTIPPAERDKFNMIKSFLM